MTLTRFVLLATLILLAPFIALSYHGCAFGPGLADWEAELCGGYSVVRISASDIVISDSRSGIVVPAKVIELDHDDRFIIVKQEHRDERGPGYPDEPQEDRAPDPGYWVIDTSTREVYGPLPEDMWLLVCGDLGVPAGFQLRDVHSFRSKAKRE